MRDKDQIFIFNNDELSLLKNTFANNDSLLYTVRKVLLQFPLTDAEKGLIKLSITPEVWAVLKKRILPDLNEHYPLGQLPSVLTTLTESLKVKDVAEMEPHFAAKKLEIDYLTQQFAVLRDDTIEETIKLADLAVIGDDALQNYINLNAYLFILGYVDPMMLFVQSIAGQKTETLEEQKERLRRDSSK